MEGGFKCCEPVLEKTRFWFGAISLGCNKNLIDTQYLLGKVFSFSRFQNLYDIRYFTDPFVDEVEYVFLNTCGFLSTSREEALANLENLLKKGKKVFLLGCWLKYFLALQKENIPEILSHSNVAFLDWSEIEYISILSLINSFKDFKSSVFKGEYKFPADTPRAYTNLLYGFEYVKISEGCNNSCSFCIIPKIRWKQRSRPVEDIIKEIKDLVAAGAYEIILISQDTTRYGIDIYKQPYLFELLSNLEQLEGDFVYRILYLYPDILSLRHLEKLKDFKKFIPYFDIPLQHISSSVLKRMRRFYDIDFIYKFLDFIDKNWEQKFVRTNFIVGFPGETEKDFEQLVEFVKKWYFDNIAVFQYHDEPLSPSFKLSDKVPDSVAAQRVQTLSEIVNKMIEQKNAKYQNMQIIGSVMDIKWEIIVVRPRLHAPEIDPYHHIKFDNVRGILGDSNGEIKIWSRILYTL